MINIIRVENYDNYFKLFLYKNKSVIGYLRIIAWFWWVLSKL